MENIIKQIFSYYEIPVPTSSTWHKDLLMKAKQESILTESTTTALLPILGFRHYFVHSYGFMLEEEPVKALIDQIEPIWKIFLDEIYASIHRNPNPNK